MGVGAVELCEGITILRPGEGHMASNIPPVNASLYPDILDSVAAKIPTQPPFGLRRKASAKQVPLLNCPVRQFILNTTGSLLPFDKEFTFSTV